MNIGKRLIRFRQEKSFSQNDLAEAIGVTQGYISHIELGRRLPSFSDLENICKVFNITLGQFFADEDLTPKAPLDIGQFAIDTKNHDLIRTIQGLQSAGYSNEVIQEWVTALKMSLENIVRQMKNRYGLDNIKPGESKVMWVSEDLIPEEYRGQYSKEEKQRLIKKVETKGSKEKE